MVCNWDVLCDLPPAYSAVFPCPHALEYHPHDELGCCVAAALVQTKQNGAAGVADELELSMGLCLHEAVSSTHKC